MGVVRGAPAQEGTTTLGGNCGFSCTYMHVCLVVLNSLRGADGVPVDGRRGRARRAHDTDRRGQAIESSAPTKVTLVASLPSH